eukprot:155531_1
MAHIYRSRGVLLGLGSNLGNRSRNIQNALSKIGFFAKVSRTSFLYETEPAYVQSQPKFLNAACRIETTLAPTELLERVKCVEAEIGREAAGRNEARCIDIDILGDYAHQSSSIRLPNLEVPHPRISERLFVLTPLVDIDPEFTVIVPDSGDNVPGSDEKTVRQLLDELLKRLDNDPSHGVSNDRGLPDRVWPVGPGDSVWHWGRRTFVMGILNATPDSFSDGGRHCGLERALEGARRIVAEGADIIDVGGLSTRPGSMPVSEEEELKRVIPVIAGIRKEFPEMPISIDTFRSEVARLSLTAGATVVNDISGGDRDPKMRETVAAAGAPFIAMHMRGTPKTMNSHAVYADVVTDVRKEMEIILQKCEESGIPRWNLVADPGIGFSKKGPQNIELLRGYRDFIPYSDFPTLSGPSRKSFMAAALGKAKSAAERDWGTAAAVAASIAGGADVIRIHNVAAMVDVCRVSDAIWRQ